MTRWPVSDDAARAMYAGGRGNADAQWYSRMWAKAFGSGLFPRRWVTLEVPGRVTGRTIRCPLGMADVGGHWYLVSMLGECNWVANVRAADGNAVLRRRRARPVRLVEVTDPACCGPILRRYVDKVPGGRPHIPVQRGGPLNDFVAIAGAYPMFEVMESDWTEGEPAENEPAVGEPAENERCRPDGPIGSIRTS